MCTAILTSVLFTKDNSQLNEITVSDDNIAFCYRLFLKVVSP